MLSELRQLLASCPQQTEYPGYRSAVVDDNVLLKKTLTTRKESFRRLRELYGLDKGILIFRALRDLWESDSNAQSLLALLCAVARDAILRSTVDLILATGAGEQVTPQMIEKATAESFPQRYNATMLANIGRHAASSWQQAGHLRGRTNKIRSNINATPAATAYALFLSYLCGGRGEGLFDTFWVHLLDAPIHQLRDLAFTASRQGLLEYRHTGAVTEITFRHLLRNEDIGIKHE